MMLGTYRDTELDRDHPLRAIAHRARSRASPRAPRARAARRRGRVRARRRPRRRGASPRASPGRLRGHGGQRVLRRRGAAPPRRVRRDRRSDASRDPRLAAEPLAVPDSVKDVIGQRVGAARPGDHRDSSRRPRSSGASSSCRCSSAWASLDGGRARSTRSSRRCARDVIDEVAGRGRPLHVLARADPRHAVRRADRDPSRAPAPSRRRRDRGRRTPPTSSRHLAELAHHFAQAGLERRPRQGDRVRLAGRRARDVAARPTSRPRRTSAGRSSSSTRSLRPGMQAHALRPRHRPGRGRAPGRRPRLPADAAGRRSPGAGAAGSRPPRARRARQQPRHLQLTARASIATAWRCCRRRSTPTTPPTARRARRCSRCSRSSSSTEHDSRRRDKLNDEAVAMARRVGDPRTLALVLTQRCVAQWTPAQTVGRAPRATSGRPTSSPIGSRIRCSPAMSPTSARTPR